MIENKPQRLDGVKFALVLTAELEKLAFKVEQVYYNIAEPDMMTTMAYFQSNAAPVVNRGEIVTHLGETRSKIIRSLEEFMNEGSGWRLKRCEFLDLRIAQCQPFCGRSCIKTPASRRHQDHGGQSACQI